MIAPGVGTVIGSVVGGISGATLGKAMSDWCTQKLFGLPQSEALENSYRFLELPCDASNDKINTSFKQKALKFHPDKGGNYEDWHKLQYCLAVIKVSFIFKVIQSSNNYLIFT